VAQTLLIAQQSHIPKTLTATSQNVHKHNNTDAITSHTEEKDNVTKGSRRQQPLLVIITDEVKAASMY